MGGIIEGDLVQKNQSPSETGRPFKYRGATKPLSILSLIGKCRESGMLMKILVL